MIQHIIYPDGEEMWLKDNKHNRVNGSTFTWLNGVEEQLQDSKTHRTNGPAVIYPDGRESWWKDNQCIRINQFATHPD